MVEYDSATGGGSASLRYLCRGGKDGQRAKPSVQKEIWADEINVKGQSHRILSNRDRDGYTGKEKNFWERILIGVASRSKKDPREGYMGESPEEATENRSIFWGKTGS